PRPPPRPRRRRPQQPRRQPGEPVLMDRQIRRLGLALVLLFVVLFLQLNNLQVLQASKLSNASGNIRNTLDNFSRPRGVIQTADGVVVARSTPTNDFYKFQRQYPEGPLFSQITGYFSFVYGSSGVEQTYTSQLAGRSLPLQHLSDLLTTRTSTQDVTLTISNQLQQVAASSLAQHAGSVVVLNPTNGNILAMYSSPTFDPNPLASHDQNVQRNAWNLYQLDPNQPMLPRAYRRTYAPGSTFKVVTASAALDRDPVLATKSYPQESSIPLPQTNLTLSNFGHETCGGTLPDLLKFSCDTGFGQMGLDLGPDNLSAQATTFGFNKKPPLDIPAVASSFPSAASFSQNKPGLAYSAIGQQDVSATTLQMALVAAGIANGGVIETPHVMSEIRDNEGRQVQSFGTKPWQQATSQSTANMVRDDMVGVVNGGTATNVAIPNVQVAAKTGTAQTSTGSGNNNWLIGFAPADNPKVAVAVVIPAQPGLGSDTTGAQIAGPIFKAVLQAALASPQGGGGTPPAQGTPGTTSTSTTTTTTSTTSTTTP
ncbi:MAG TPA: penicillin-binding transpeptidase domain-containing protein, partial [Acidimicrobiales bacterium]|nr:penicillin-binding transpeptidase domain-containing protein [Acidimicrobiales bacterium]